MLNHTTAGDVIIWSGKGVQNWTGVEAEWEVRPARTSASYPPCQAMWSNTEVLKYENWHRLEGSCRSPAPVGCSNSRFVSMRLWGADSLVLGCENGLVLAVILSVMNFCEFSVTQLASQNQKTSRLNRQLFHLLNTCPGSSLNGFL